MVFFHHRRILLLASAFHAAVAVELAISPREDDCSNNTYPGPSNPGFETGTLANWTIVSGTAFGNLSVSSAEAVSGEPFNQIGTYHLWGSANDGEAAVGELHSTTFQASSIMSFLVSGGWDPINLYVGLVKASDDTLLVNQTGLDDEAYIRITWDTSAWAGLEVYVKVFDNNTATSWGHINLDDIRTGCNATIGEDGLTFNVLGDANQPADDGTLSDAQLFAVDPFRPQYHYTPYQGWINDPCGLSEWDDKHQLFNQYYPAAPFSGPIHWSHANSDDAVHWRRQPIALYPPYPDDPSDESGRWTGSAINDTGTLRLIFTDYTDTSVHPNATQEVISTADSSDGLTFPLYAGNPIIPEPPADSPSGFRDPKVFFDPTDSTYKLVVGSGDTTSGKIQLYQANSTSNLVSWNYLGVLIEGDGTTGVMWECPNFFPLDDKWVLFYGGNGQNWWHVGSYNGSLFTIETTGLLDAGNIYASQMYIDSSDRRLLMGWMYNFNTPKYPTRVNGYVGSTSITRELFLRDDGGLGSRPIAEIASLANGTATTFDSQTITDTLPIGNSSQARLQMSIDLASTTAPSFTIKLFSSSAEATLLNYTVSSSTLTLDTTNAGYGQVSTWNTTTELNYTEADQLITTNSSISTHGAFGRVVSWSMTVATSSDVLELDILLDRTSLEIFAADGSALTAAIYPRYQESNQIEVVVESGAVALTNATLTPFGSMWA